MDPVRTEALSLEKAIKRLLARRLKRLESVCKEDRGIFIETSIFVRDGKAQLLSRPLNVVALQPKVAPPTRKSYPRKK